MGVIQLETAVPGPNSRALTARRARAVPRGVPASTPLAIVQADGAVLTDADGNRLIDFAGGIGVMNVGHRNRRVVDAVRAQLDAFTHVCFPVASYEPYIALAERLNAVTPGTHEKRTLFVNSGAEAVENAVKIARASTGRPAIVAFDHAFHGRTNLAMALTAKVNPYKKGFGPFAPEIYRIPFPYTYRHPELATFDRTFAGLVDPQSVAAIIIELQLGEGGFVPAPPSYVSALAAFAQANGILLIDDEIQTGFGRTGKLFAAEHYGLVPDLVICAKSLAAGLPLAAVTGRADIMDAPQVGGLGGTYGGNPLACAAALAVLDAMEQDNIPARAARLGERIGSQLRCFAEQDRGIGDVRGLGAMKAIELVHDGKEPDKERTGAVLAEALARGLVVLSAGTYGNVVRILSPLTIEDETLDEGLAVLGAALKATR
jgi:4-aminobutyrate aminotransferase / (S)-3-amino-2-methylpropionate transaminase / 5-aminovalerate transaminase